MSHVARLPTFRRSIASFKSCLKRPDYWILCSAAAAPTELVKTSTNTSESETSSILDAIDLQTAAFDTVGFTLFVVGSCTFAWCKVSQMANQNRLITYGFWRYSRNPMAISCMVSVIGASILTHYPLLMVGVPSMTFAVLHLFAVTTEEKQLLEQFGDEYQQYMQKTARWIGFHTNSSAPNNDKL